ncbi:6422_t:CDS:2 [Cetraspora pellucida]|uniref:6422_t:CDS:1 n=1 Tax=Cetraspora pellucida TaxID=1433469 RepID=A0ACA9M8U2_9GLOM|nr:6422_t:CDS:2 [Cetraspora pellucida]
MAPSPQFIVRSPINRGQGSNSNNNGNFFTRFLRDEIFSPEKRQGIEFGTEFRPSDLNPDSPVSDLNSDIKSIMTSFSAPSSDLDSNESYSSIFETENSITSLRKKCKTDLIKSSNRKNKSHTVYFFRKDPNNYDIAYCIICEQNNQKSYPYSRKGGSTSNLFGHLRDKHSITAHNYRNYLNANNKDDDFCAFIHGCESGFHISCDKTAKNLIHEAYLWSKDQLQNLLNKSTTSINLTTDLWTVKSNHGYIRVIALDIPQILNFMKFYSPQWQLSDMVFTIITNNGANMIKSICILNESYFSTIKRNPYTAHTLQLSVQEGLRQCKDVHRHIKNLQCFFKLPKQAQRLQKAQNKNNVECKENAINSLNVLLDTRT